MRKDPTEPERRLWMALRDRRFEGFKFRRQSIVGSRIVDFFCPTKGLIVEIDGHTHDPERDRQRDAAVWREFGFRTLRFTNPEVMQNFDGVLAALQLALRNLPERWPGEAATTPRPPPLKRRGRPEPVSKAPSSSEEGVGGGAAAQAAVGVDQTVAQAIRAATYLLGAKSDSARLDAELLMAHALGASRSELFLRRMDDPAPATFAALVERRAAHEPVAYITGRQEFYGLGFAVSPAVLIPRGDSETLVEAALAAAPHAPEERCRVLDLGTGSGALLLAVLHGLPWAEGVGIDRSEAALAVAAGNAAELGLAQRARFQPGDWTKPDWADALGQFDLILANPPYVETGAPLDPDVRDYEPAGALFAGLEGLDDYRVLIPQLPALLAPDGTALVEIGAAQAGPVGAIAAAAGLAATLHRDLADRPRVLALVKK